MKTNKKIKQMKNFKSIIVMLLISFTFSSCTRDNEKEEQSEIVGNWQITREYGTIVAAGMTMTIDVNATGYMNLNADKTWKGKDNGGTGTITYAGTTETYTIPGNSSEQSGTYTYDKNTQKINFKESRGNQYTSIITKISANKMVLKTNTEGVTGDIYTELKK